MVEKANMRRKISQKKLKERMFLKFFAKNLFGMQSAISVEDAFCKHCGGKQKTEEES